MDDDYEKRVVALEGLVIQLYEQLRLQGKVILNNKKELKAAREAFLEVQSLLSQLLRDYIDREDKRMDEWIKMVIVKQKYPI